ncbi:hypothetical protein [Hymenobacter sublimis]|uniref:LamG domain-containing protein n=1 Tax=Hymenobacter sublimis TaxID=2933777 RepID=A0ABY4JCK7_9BACT|nr:hypothetical protein [Hymenobacter sublimis]UPL50533.1 hypothetical protein MWH26_06400 [Hymenobacter sublimis]
MAEELEESFIKDLPEILTPDELYPTHFEVEDSSGAEPENKKVGFGTVVNAITAALPGANNSKTLYKSARLYDRNVPGGNATDETLADLNPDFLALGAICWVEFPQPSKEYRLVYASNGQLSVWLDGSFSNIKVSAQWVERDSLEDKNAGIQDFVPFVSTYSDGDVVKFYIDGVLRLFSAKQDLVKSSYPDKLIPEPTGLSTDTNWEEVNGTGLTRITSWLKGEYKLDEVVAYNSQLFRAKRAFTSTVAPASGTDWEVFAGAGGGLVYDDTELRARVENLEQASADLLDNIETAKVDLNARIDALVTAAEPWRAGSYVTGQFILSGGNVFVAKQDIATSTIAPTTSNVYWLQVNAASSGGTGGTSYDDTELRELINDKVTKVAGKGLSTNDYTSADKTKLAGLQNYNDAALVASIATKVDKITGKQLSTNDYTNTDKAKLASLENYALQADSVSEDILTEDVRIKLNAVSTIGDTIDASKVIVNIVGITENIGSFKAGDSYSGTQAGFNEKLVKKYHYPVFNYLHWNGEGSRTVEAGTTFNSTDTFTWSIGNTINSKANTISIKSDGVVIGSGLANDGSEVLDIPAFTLQLGESKSFEINAINTQNESFARSITIDTALARYYGASALTPAQLKAAVASTADGVLSNKAIGGGRGLDYNFDCSGGKYPYYLYRADLGNPSGVQQGPTTFSSYTVEDITIKDKFGVSRSYKLLYTDTIQTAGSFNLKIN